MEEKEKKPMIRFKGFTEAWEQRKLGDISEIVGGGTPSTNIDEYWNGDINWYSPAEIGEQIVVNTSQRKITKLGLEKSSARMLPKGTVLFTSRAGIGNTAILGDTACTNQGFQSIVPDKEQLDSYFIFSRSKELKDYGERVGAGSTFVEVSGKQMSEMELLIPDLDEQKIIGCFFERIDNLITLHQRKYDKLVNVKKSLLEKMFPKNDSDMPKIRFKGFTEAWEQRKLGQIYKFQYGEFNNNPSNGGKYPVYGANGIIGGYTKYNSEDSVIIGHMGEYAGSVLWGDGKHFVTYNGTISKPKDDFIKSKFGYYMLLQKDINKICGGSGLPFLSYEQLDKIEVSYPKDKKEQSLIENYLTNIDNLITLHQRKLEKLKNIKKSLLEKMFV